MLSAIFIRDESFTAILDDLEKNEAIGSLTVGIVEKTMTGNDQ